MIVSKIAGGIGNQIFQWAVAKSFSLKNNTSYALDLSFYSQNWHNRRYALSHFGIDSSNIILKDKLYIIIKDDFNYEEIPYYTDKHVYLDGYWQSDKYFYEHKNEIINILKPKEWFKKKIVEKYPHIFENTVSIHVRRTDYLTSGGYHPVMDISYYNNAIDMIGKYDKIYIFSDDINWCKENLNYGNIIFVENQTEIEDFWHMSLCKNNIIANSTFSWWSSYINEHKEKMVISPSKWFGEQANLNVSDLLPENWIKI